MPLDLFYTMVQKSQKWPKTQIKGGSCLNSFFVRQASLSASDGILPNILAAPVTDSQTLTELSVSLQDVQRALHGLDARKAPGSDGIPTRWLVVLANEIAPRVHHIFSLSLRTATVPTEWKSATVRPIYKERGSKQVATNYRPISLLCILSKCLEKLIFRHLYSHLDPFLPSHQAGFRQKDSTTYQLARLIHRLASALDQGHTTLACFYDLSKAFDQVWHRGLLAKLYHFGVRGQAHVWITNDLSDRRQYVRLNQPPNNGLRHGTVGLDMQRQPSWQLVSWQRTAWSWLHQKLKKKPFLWWNSISTWALFNQTIFLGPLISHVHVLAEGKRKAGFLRYMAKELPADLVSKIYITYVRPTLEYASPVWHGDLSKQQSLALERVQASVARWILKAPWTTPKNVLFEQLQWPSLSWRRSIATTCLLHQLLQNPTDPLKDCLFPFSSTVSSYNFRKPRQLILPTTRTPRYLNSFFYHSALLWNSLPSSIQSLTKPNHFRQALTSHWREQKYQPVSELFWLTNPLPHHFLFYFIFFFQMLINAMCCYLPFWRPPRSGNFPVGESVKY